MGYLYRVFISMRTITRKSKYFRLSTKKSVICINSTLSGNHKTTGYCTSYYEWVLFVWWGDMVLLLNSRLNPQSYRMLFFRQKDHVPGNMTELRTGCRSRDTGRQMRWWAPSIHTTPSSVPSLQKPVPLLVPAGIFVTEPAQIELGEDVESLWEICQFHSEMR